MKLQIEKKAASFGILLLLAECLSAVTSQATAVVKSSIFQSLTESFYNNIIVDGRYMLILEGLRTTLIISIFAVLLGGILGAFICLLNMSKVKILPTLARIYITILRGTPVLVLLMIIFYIVFASVNIDAVYVAIIAFALNFAAYSAEIFRTGIEGIDNGQREAGIALGFNKTETFIHIIMPQALRSVIPILKGDIITLVKMTSVVGYVAVHDLTKAGDLIRSRTFDAFFPLIMVAVLYFFLSWTIIKLIEFVDNKTNRRLQVASKGL